MFKEVALNYLNEKRDELIKVSKEIWANPELGHKEHFASKRIAEILESEGFDVELGYVNIPTAIKATYGSGSPVIGLLGEYDALPGLSQKVSTTEEPIIQGAPGHGCGHNLLGVCKLAAAIAIKEGIKQGDLKGTIVFYGCPAEEQLTGKPFMARGGAFRDIDMAISWHPASYNIASYASKTALNSAKFHFKGKTAHAALDPQNGRSALSAVELMNVGANYLREHVTDDVRIHYVITDGGGAPNVVPDKATVFYFVRALTREAVVDTYNRLVKIAEGAAMMTETQLEVELLGGCYNYLVNKVLVDLSHKVMTETKRPEWTEEELYLISTRYHPTFVETCKLGKTRHLTGRDTCGVFVSVGLNKKRITPYVMLDLATNQIILKGVILMDTIIHEIMKKVINDYEKIG